MTALARQALNVHEWPLLVKDRIFKAAQEYQARAKAQQAERKRLAKQEAAKTEQRRADVDKLLRQARKACNRHRRPGSAPGEGAGRGAKSSRQGAAPNEHALGPQHAGPPAGRAAGRGGGAGRVASAVAAGRGDATNSQHGGHDRQASRSGHSPGKAAQAAVAAAIEAQQQEQHQAELRSVPQSNVVECTMMGTQAAHTLDVVNFKGAKELRSAVCALFPGAEAHVMVLVSVDSGEESMLVNKFTPWPWLQRECRSLKLRKRPELGLAQQ